MKRITWTDFEQVELRVGTVLQAKYAEGARKPALLLEVDFGPEIGIKKSSAQITRHYSEDEIIGKQVVAVCNFEPKQIGKHISEVLITGFPDQNGDVVLISPDMVVPNGAKLF